MTPLPDPSFTPAYIVAVVTTVVSLALTQGLITDHTAQLVTGIASFVIPALIVAVHALTKTRTHAAKITAAPAMAALQAKSLPPSQQQVRGGKR